MAPISGHLESHLGCRSAVFGGLDNDPGPVEVIVISHNREPGSQKKGRVPVICIDCVEI